MTNSRLGIISGAAVAGLLTTAAPACAVYGQEGETAAVEKTAAARSPDCEQAAARAKADRGRIVYVGPRHNVKMRLDGDKTKKEADRACLADRDVESRTIYVGPRHNIRKRIVKTQPKNN